MTGQNATRLLLVQALLDRSPQVAAASGRAWLDAVDVQTIGHDQARMLPMLYKRLHSLGVEQPPLLRGTYRKAWVQNQLRFREAAAFLSRLRAEGVPSLVLKGASLVPAYGGDWGLRDMSDVDALIAPEHLERALDLLESEGWEGLRGVSARSVAIRLPHRRHSWNFVHPEGHQVDLHWHVFATSLGRNADAAFWSAAVPLQLGPTSAQRFCDGDLLLHVLEHAGHDEENSRVQWAADAVTLLRSTPNVRTTALRLAEQAASHDLLPATREKLALLVDITHEPRVLQVVQALRRHGERRPSLVAEHRRGGVSLLPAVVSAVSERLDAGLARSRAAWALYVATGRRPFVERLVHSTIGPLATTVRAPTTRGTDGWWDLSDAATVDKICGPGWSFPEPEQGLWSDGPEARLVLPTRRARTLELELQVLARYGGPARSVEVRVDGRVQRMIEATAEPDWPVVLTLKLPRAQIVEVAFIIRRPGRPADLGLGADARQLGVLVRRLRFR